MTICYPKVIKNLSQKNNLGLVPVGSKLISIQVIFQEFHLTVKNSRKFPVGKRASIRVLGLESLVVAKHKAARDQDIEDLGNIAQRIGEIDWNTVRQITGDQFMTDNIRRDMEFLSK